ncbi:MAG TPA: 5-oxoprolinase subunit PxpA [Ferrovibrio sp.]|uniref:LamB/YcsF family protein n=1 Tax=Ferrovibrio sp. TaxID=1917215 RepID=UPI002ED4E7EC
MKVNLNSDLGESYGAWTMGDDAAMLAVVASANIACGFHGGDWVVMQNTVAEAIKNGVSIGAHPSYPDLQGFGRRPMTMSNKEVEALMAYQIGALIGVAATKGGTVTHVKPHGAINNKAATDKDLAAALARGIAGVSKDLIFLAPAGSAMVEAAAKANLPVAQEVFADRNYDDEGNLVPRGQPNAMVHDNDQALANVLRMVQERAIVSVNGKKIPCAVDSICVHGDSAGAVSMARHIRAGLEKAGVKVVTLPEMLA